MNNENALMGALHETIFAELVQLNPQTMLAIVRNITPNIDTLGLSIERVETIGQLGKKSDVVITTNKGWAYGASVKSFSGSGFNQVTRMTIDNFANQFSLSSRVTTALKEITIEKARGRNRNWIVPPYTKLITEEFRLKAVEIIEYCLLGEDTPELLVLSSEDETKIRLYAMDEILHYCKQTLDVTVTPRGVLRLNQCFGIQKKGGNGKHEKYAKDDLRHGGNNIQVKMKPSVLVSNISPITVLAY